MAKARGLDGFVSIRLRVEDGRKDKTEDDFFYLTVGLNETDDEIEIAEESFGSEHHESESRYFLDAGEAKNLIFAIKNFLPKITNNEEDENDMRD